MGNVVGTRALVLSALGAVLCLPWAVAIYSGDQVSAWLGDAFKDSIRSSSSASDSRLEVLRQTAEVPPESMFPLDRSPGWIATVRDPLEEKKHLVIWLAQNSERRISLKLIEEGSQGEMSFAADTRWTWLSESSGPLLRVSLDGGPYSTRYKEIQVRLPQVSTVEGEIRWISHDDKAFVSRFGWVPSPEQATSALSKPLMSRVIGSL